VSLARTSFRSVIATPNPATRFFRRARLPPSFERGHVREAVAVVVAGDRVDVETNCRIAVLCV